MPQRVAIARVILEIFKMQHAKVGYIVPSSLLIELSSRRGWSRVQLEDGLKYGGDQGWFNVLPNSFVTLAELGVTEMEKASDADGLGLASA
jgi:hypothetical protein